MNRIWENILRTAIAGAERHPVSDADVLTLGITTGTDPVQTIIRALPAAKILQKAAAPLATGTNALPEPCPPDERPICNAQAATPLKTMLLNGAFQEAIPEYFQLLQKSGQRLPAEYIPLLLDWAARKRIWTPEMQSAAGPIGFWLARQHPDWTDIFPEKQADWQTGTFAQRLQLLHKFRQNSPLVGLAQLEKTWKQERAEHRVRFLELLRTGLSLADEDLLQKALDDKSRPVRFLAYRLLLLLPDSRLRQNLTALLEQHFSKKNALERLLQLPEKTAREAGFWSNTRLLSLLPEQTTDPLETWLHLAPPEDLAQHSGQTPEQLLIYAFPMDGNPEQISTALLDHIAWRKEPDWLLAAANYFSRYPEHPVWTSDALKNVLLALPEVEWLQILTALAKQERLLEQDKSALVQALLASEQPWPNSLVEALVYYPQRSERPRQWAPPRHFAAMLARAAYYCTTDLIEAIHAPDREWPFAWQQELIKFRGILAFRRTMRQAFV